ncbi:Plasmodium exported protein, unknown function [Plasmodium relictum]|uniref:Plasmodium RESA N-terminal domain-containing protein n=1 Tax=Plasmodium relictum TaxID=85471 RepID=A0A1J1GKU1_PLARL|nr:Plasmodium exported protein, unknown function [Plasmodium relictum]CRG85693.1 Plasmodium exported protein, unknown function [Plasmodium relictum]
MKIDSIINKFILILVTDNKSHLKYIKNSFLFERITFYFKNIEFKYLRDSNNTTIKNYSTNSCINKRETANKKSRIIPIFLKLFTMLFLGLLCFLLGCLFKEENMKIYVSKFDKDHLRILAEKESEYINKYEYLDKTHENFKEEFKRIITSLVDYILIYWENMCYHNSSRLSLFGRIWEQEKYEYLFNKIIKDIKDISGKFSGEYKIFKKKDHTDKECSAFFKKKKKDLTKFEEKQHRWIIAYSDKCKKEWKYIERNLMQP